MITPPRYKTARRLGPAIYDKTQTQKYAARFANRNSQKTVKHPRQLSDFGKQMLEKQKVRFTYGVGERQFVKYVKNVVAEKGSNSADKLFGVLETRADNIVYRIGLAPSRAAARQMVSHGHILINAKKISIPSMNIKKGDIVRVREGSLKKPLFRELDEKIKAAQIPNWIAFKADKKEWEVIGTPNLSGSGAMFDLQAVLEFYSR